MSRNYVALKLLPCVILLSGCAPSGQQQDLLDFMAEVKKRPQGQIEALPTFAPYQSYAYSAMTLRSPFEKPVIVDESAAKGGRAVAPDLDREREFLEGFNIASLKMVGTLAKSKQLWALMDNNEGTVARVTIGNFLGKNHGKIISTSSSQIEVMEIVSDGSNGWVERPRIIKLEQKE